MEVNYSGDGHHIVVAGGKQAYVFEGSSGAIQYTIRVDNVITNAQFTRDGMLLAIGTEETGLNSRSARARERRLTVWAAHYSNEAKKNLGPEDAIRIRDANG